MNELKVELKRVTKEEFDSFINNYFIGELITDNDEPANEVTYNDFELAESLDLKDSTVAKYTYDERDDTQAHNQYYIASNIDSLISKKLIKDVLKDVEMIKYTENSLIVIGVDHKIMRDTKTIKIVIDKIKSMVKVPVIVTPKEAISMEVIEDTFLKQKKKEVIKTLKEWKENSDVVSIDSMIALIENRF